MQDSTINVTTEVGRLRRLIIHSPDSGLGKVVPSKAQDWLFEDIVHLETMRKDEYDLYVQILLYFLDPDKIKGKLKSVKKSRNRAFFKPSNPNYFNSKQVIEFENLLKDVLKKSIIKTQLVAAVCAIEECSYTEMQEFLSMTPAELVRVLITGITTTGEFFFPPVPNLIFTRDIGIVVNDHLILNKPARMARTRESLLAKYVFFNHSLFESLRGKIIEIEEDEMHFLLPEDEQALKLETLEGGDVMMVAPNHLMIGISERTSVEAARQVIEKLFKKNIVSKVTLVKIPAKRDYMHIDTIFTQVKRNVWVLLASLGKTGDFRNREHVWEELGQRYSQEELTIRQFYLEDGKTKNRTFLNLEDLLSDISITDLKSKEPVKFVYSGNNVFPYGEREQWTDSCNLLVVKEGVAIGYDRNDHTSEAFKEAGFNIITAAELLVKFEKEELSPDTIENTIILLPSAELSRARGGSHCMSLPLLRDTLF
ncbi:MAG: arginine deiminase [Spirosomataceae bacterium]|jgi:arginine deiminase